MGDLLGKDSRDLATDSANDMANIAKKIFGQTDPLRTNMLSSWEKMIGGGDWDVTQAPMFGQGKFNIGSQYNTARDNIMESLPSGGTLQDAISKSYLSEAGDMANMMGNIGQDEYNKAYGMASGAPQQVMAGLGGAGQLGAQNYGSKLGKTGDVGQGLGYYLGNKPGVGSGLASAGSAGAGAGLGTGATVGSGIGGGPVGAGLGAEFAGMDLAGSSGAGTAGEGGLMSSMSAMPWAIPAAIAAAPILGPTMTSLMRGIGDALGHDAPTAPNAFDYLKAYVNGTGIPEWGISAQQVQSVDPNMLAQLIGEQRSTAKNMGSDIQQDFKLFPGYTIDFGNGLKYTVPNDYGAPSPYGFKGY